MKTKALCVLLVASFARADEPAGGFQKINPIVIAASDARAKDLPKTLSADVRRRIQEASLRESKTWATVATKEQWEEFRDVRIKALRAALGTFPERPAKMSVRITGTVEGDGYRIDNLLYETRPGLWVSANLYRPARPTQRMPGILISHSHHNAKSQGELQDMGMTWARADCAVLVPDHIGHGERRQHDFHREADYPMPFRVGRQDYYFRFNTGLQLQLIGESLLGWMVWDLQRGVDVLLQQPGINPQKIILLGAVAGGGDPAGVAAALDPRIACVAPFNFGGVQPDYTTPANTDRDFYWFGDADWESTRSLRYGARDGFAHWLIVASIAPRRLIYSYEFAWDPKTDPAWPRLQKVFGFYGAADRLRTTQGTGNLKGNPPESSHCNNIGAIHRQGIHAALNAWFDMPIPKEYSKRRSSDELTCWTASAKRELKPRLLHEAAGEQADQSRVEARKLLESLPEADRSVWLREEWGKRLGAIDSPREVTSTVSKAEVVPGGQLERFALQVEPSVTVPMLLLTPTEAPGKCPVVVMVCQQGKQVFLQERGAVLAAFLKAGIAVCLPDVRGTGETRPRDTGRGKNGTYTTVSARELLLGQTLVGAQLRDLRAVLAYLRNRPHIDGKKMAIWGDSFAPTNPSNSELKAPLDAADLPGYAEPLGGLLALFGSLYEETVGVVYSRGGLSSYRSVLDSPYCYLPHNAIIPGAIAIGDIDVLASTLSARKSVKLEGQVDGRNRPVGAAADLVKAAEWVIREMKIAR